MQNDNQTGSIPISEVRSKLTPFILNAGIIVRDGAVFRLDQRVLGTAPGINQSVTYATQDEAVNALFRAWFPQAAGVRAA